MKLLIWTSVVLYVAELIIGSKNSLESPAFFLWAERLIALIFTGEIYYRWKTEERYINTPLFWVDIVSVVPFWVGFLAICQPFLGEIRALRVLRLLKLFRYHRSLQLFAISIYNVRLKLQSLSFVFFVVVILQICLLYEAEKLAQPGVFDNIFNLLYFTIISTVTIGYGDLSPITPFGKLIVCSVGILGFILVIVASGCIASSYTDLMNKEYKEDNLL